MADENMLNEDAIEIYFDPKLLKLSEKDADKFAKDAQKLLNKKFKADKISKTLTENGANVVYQKWATGKGYRIGRYELDKRGRLKKASLASGQQYLPRFKSADEANKYLEQPAKLKKLESNEILKAKERYAKEQQIADANQRILYLKEKLNKAESNTKSKQSDILDIQKELLSQELLLSSYKGASNIELFKQVDAIKEIDKKKKEQLAIEKQQEKEAKNKIANESKERLNSIKNLHEETKGEKELSSALLKVVDSKERLDEINSDENARQSQKLDAQIELLKNQKALSKLEGASDLNLIKQDRAISDLVEQKKDQLKVEKLLNKEADNARKIRRAQELSDILASNMSPIEQKQAVIGQKKFALGLLEDEYGAMADDDPRLEEKRLAIQKLREEIVALNAELAKMKRISPFERLFNTFKRLGFYRLGRNFFRLIEGGLGNAVRSLSIIDPSTNQALSQLTTSFTQLSSVIVLTFTPIIKTIEPLLTGLSNVFVVLGNTISLFFAKLNKQNKYLKVSLDYWKEFNKQTNLFSFDKFETLNGDDNPYKEVSIDDVTDTLADSRYTLDAIVATITTISALPIISWLITGSAGFFTSAGALFDKLKILNALKVGGIILGLVEVAKAITTIKETIENWNTAPAQEKVDKLLRSILTMVSALALLKGVLSGNFLLSVVGVSGIFASNILPKMYANGGLVDTGSLFIAGESGAELVTTMPSGQTGVTNVAQFKEAMVSAIYECSDIFQQKEGSVVLNLDGAEIARSKRFTSEVNRKNTGLNLK